MSTVLVVEDDLAAREALVESLGDAGYQVAAARDGYDALEQLDRGLRPFVILLDLMMDRMDGFDFRSEQRSIPAIADIPVVVMSANHALLQKAAVLEADAYLAKPMRLHDLLGTVHDIEHRTVH